MNAKNLLIGLLLSCISYNTIAQVDITKSTRETDGKQRSAVLETRYLYPRKGKFFVFWGYNRAAYSNSNMNFSGQGYNFNIYDIRATDDPTNFSSVYFGLTKFTIPQFNYRVGYFLSDKNYVSFGSDHMKYTIVKQATRLTGTISTGVNDGVYNNTEVVVGENCDANNPGPNSLDNLPKGFVSGFEHCDGLNDFSFELGRMEQLWISNNHKHAFAFTGSVGLGMVIPDTDADVLGQPPKHDMEAGKKAYHLAGYSASATMGLQLDLFNRVFVLARLKGGYINLPDINTTAYGGKASQHFLFIEPMVVLGYSFYINTKHNHKKA